MNERWHRQWAHASGGVTMLRLQHVGRPIPAACREPTSARI
jgi:hypothetical protein